MSSLLEAAPELASSNNMSQHVFWAANFVFGTQLHNRNLSRIYITLVAQWQSG
jgi:hypothetical protein